jgi:hypothetical protein
MAVGSVGDNVSFPASSKPELLLLPLSALKHSTMLLLHYPLVLTSVTSTGLSFEHAFDIRLLRAVELTPP